MEEAANFCSLSVKCSERKPSLGPLLADTRWAGTWESGIEVQGRRPERPREPAGEAVRSSFRLGSAPLMACELCFALWLQIRRARMQAGPSGRTPALPQQRTPADGGGERMLLAGDTGDVGEPSGALPLTGARSGPWTRCCGCS